MRIDYTDHKFEITGSYADSMLVRNMPQRKFLKKPFPHWEAKPLKGNARYIRQLFEKRAEITPAARDKLDELLAQDIADLGLSWPLDYRFKTEPYSKQLEALRFIHNKPAWALFADMGTGKTKMTLDLFSMYAKAGVVQGLIAVSRVSLRQNWIDEVEKHVPDDLKLDTFVIDSTSSRLMKEAHTPKKGPFIISVGVESLSTKEQGGKAFDAVYHIASKYPCMMVIDEAHSVKNHKSLRTVNSDIIAKQCKIRGILTGTPTTKDFLDLYSQFSILDPDILGYYNYYAFRNRYVVMGGYEGKQVVAYRNESELMDKIRPYTMRFALSDVTDLPDKVYQRREIQMPKELSKLYAEMKNDRSIILEGEAIEARNILSSYAKLRQLANGFVYGEDKRYDLATNHPKIGELLDILEGTDEKVIVWVNTHGEIETLYPHLKKYGVAMHHGKMTPAEREASKESFRNKDRIFLATIASASVGLTLNEATIEIFYSNPLSYADRIQAEARAHRIGQKNTVRIIDLIVKGTVEEVIWTALMLKKDILEYVLGSVAEKEILDKKSEL